MRYNSFMQTKKFKVSIVISNYNGEDLLKKNLSKTLKLAEVPKNSIIETIIVDDGSSDGSTAFIKENFPQVRLIRHKKQRGVSAAFNTGVRSARGELILMISIDMVPEKELLESLLPHFNDPKVFAVSFHENGIGPEKAFWKDGFIEFKKSREAEKVVPTFYVRKGEGIYRRKIWMELGGMDEKLFLPFYWEDLDISYRAAKAGYINLWEPKAVVKHDHWGTVGQFPKKFIESKNEQHMLFMIWKNIQSAYMMRKHILGIFKKIFKKPSYLFIVLSALGRLAAVFKLRRKAKKSGKVSDEIIFSRFSS